MYPHRIRLRGPWECAVIAPLATPLPGEEAPPARRVTMPCRWRDTGLADYRGLACFTRKFGYPGKADRDIEHIWLTCAGSTGVREVRLNGQLLASATSPRFAFDVTSLMRERNQLDVLIDGAVEDAGLWGEVALEIRMDAYLADVRFESESTSAWVAGQVVGVAAEPLELYTLVDGRHVDYRTIRPRPEGVPFRIDLPSDTPQARLVRVDLIHVSTIWYSVELLIPHGDKVDATPLAEKSKAEK